jgi:hypothetical protein
MCDEHANKLETCVASYHGQTLHFKTTFEVHCQPVFVVVACIDNGAMVGFK